MCGKFVHDLTVASKAVDIGVELSEVGGGRIAKNITGSLSRSGDQLLLLVCAVDACRSQDLTPKHVLNIVVPVHTTRSVAA